jgi:adenine-specific DNA-methyltransferase
MPNRKTEGDNPSAPTAAAARGGGNSLPEVASEGPESFDLRSHTISEDKLQELLRLFPEVQSEGGKVDFNRLKLALGESVDAGKERYGLSWPGKADCFRAIQTPSRGTLLPVPDQSVNWDTTHNLIIEGDNLEVLKLLQKSYLGKVKMIYIDPPYNTGNDFIYPDNYAESLQTYLEYTGQVDSQGKKFSTNADTEGRFHSKWLNMMYPRLYLARNLLREDGVIFVSIDDGELCNLRQVLDEIFGTDNFILQFIWKKRGSAPNDKIVGAIHEYVVCYARNGLTAGLFRRARDNENLKRYKNPDNHPKGPWAPDNLMANIKGGRFVKSLYFPIRNPSTGEDHFPSSGGNWRFNREKISRLLRDREIYFGEDGLGRPKLKRFLCDVREGLSTPSIWDDLPFNNAATAEIESIFGNVNVFETPKPVGLIDRMLGLTTNSKEPALVLDFFAGSGATAEAVLRANARDGGSRHFILVQLPEPTVEDSEARKAGFPTISAICEERVRRVIDRLSDEAKCDKSLGFRVYKLAESNFKAWDSERPADGKSLQQRLTNHVHHIRDDRSERDILTELLLKSGFPPTTSVSEVAVGDKKAYMVAEGHLVVCLDRKLTLEAIRAIADLKPERVVCLDEGFEGNDQLKVNAAQTFKSKGVTSFLTV